METGYGSSSWWGFSPAFDLLSSTPLPAAIGMLFYVFELEPVWLLLAT